MRIIITTLLLALLLTGCSGQMIGVADESLIEKELIEIEKIVEKAKEDKYKRIPKYEKDGVIYEVNEYEMPKGEVGYQIYIETDTYIQSIGSGVLSEHLDFKDYKIATST